MLLHPTRLLFYLTLITGTVFPFLLPLDLGLGLD